jgi:hypothetical protein
MKRFLNSCNKNTQFALMMALLWLPQLACSTHGTAPMKPSTPQSAEDAALKQKFRGVHGGELRVDATFEVDAAVIINVDTGRLFNIGVGTFRPGSNKVSGYGGTQDGDRLVMPRHLRMMRYPEGARFLGYNTFPHYQGTSLVDVTVPVAARIPEEVLDDLRNNGGNLRLKLRIHPDTLLVGWDIVRRPGYKPGMKDSSGAPIYFRSLYSSIGGDFREATRFNGRVVEAGWYIDPKTGQRIETDY